MPRFEELFISPETAKTMTSLAYWLGTLSIKASLDELDAGHLGEVMSAQYGMEDQNFARDYRKIDPFVNKHFAPISPVTLARRWCPINSAASWLGEPAWMELELEAVLTRTAAAVWDTPDPELIEEATATSEDEAHFRFLLGLTAMRAFEKDSRILLVCCPGWSFEDAQEMPMGAFGYSALSAGRLYPERIPSSAIKLASI